MNMGLCWNCNWQGETGSTWTETCHGVTYPPQTTGETLTCHLYILIVCLRIVIVPAGTLRVPWLRVFRAFSSAVRQIPGYNSQRRGTARTFPKFLCWSVYCLCVNVHCTAATGWQPNRSLTYIISYHIISYWTGLPLAMKPATNRLSHDTTNLPHAERLDQVWSSRAVPGSNLNSQISQADWRFPYFASVSSLGFRNRINVRPR